MLPVCRRVYMLAGDWLADVMLNMLTSATQPPPPPCLLSLIQPAVLGCVANRPASVIKVIAA